MRVLIVSRTRMRGHVCVGGLTLEDPKKNVRLLLPNGENPPESCPYRIGVIWDFEFERRPGLVPPHVEDVLISSSRRVGMETNMEQYLRANVPIWDGSPRELFDGFVQFTRNHAVYVSYRTALPLRSVGFWTPSRSLEREDDVAGTGVRYLFDDGQTVLRIKYVGQEPPIDSIAEGTLLRVSLARWWRPADAHDMEERCYAQLSGWYGS